jgi:hypothetical protein
VSPYRHPVAVPARPSIADVIKEAWRICKERQAVAIGPKPAWWRLYALASWRHRSALAACEAPDECDLLDALTSLGADGAMLIRLFKAHDAVHRGRT